ncbi:MAG: hypothetical protein K9N52_04795 [Verrucomicrobia bacterium]|nr:hypothetical protein [Verrucomicrobiota bacterium]
MKTKYLVIALLTCLLSISAQAGVTEEIEELVPRLSDKDVSARYEPQMAVQEIVLNAARPGAEAERAKVAGILAAKVVDDSIPMPARVWLVRQLQYIGAGEAVDALAELLKSDSDRLRECARRALEKNPSAAAAKTLRAALKKGGERRWVIGLVNSLSELEDAKAVPLISERLQDPELLNEAAQALGKIATDEAINALWKSYDPEEVIVANALIEAGNVRLSRGDDKAASDVFGRILKTSKCVQVRSAALDGLSRSNPPSTLEFLPDALQSDAGELQRTAVDVTFHVYGRRFSREYAPKLSGLPADTRVLVMEYLDRRAEQAVIEQIDSENAEVRETAMETLGRIGSGKAVVALLESAAAGPSKDAARRALSRIYGRGVNLTLRAKALEAEPTVQAAAVTALADRNDKAALGLLFRVAKNPAADDAVKDAVFSALGRLGDERRFTALADLAVETGEQGAFEAVKRVAARVENKKQITENIVAIMQDADAKGVAELLDVLRIVGGTDALAAVAEKTSSENADIREAAVRSLADWTTFDAVDPLLEVASKDDVSAAFNALAIRGLVKLVKSNADVEVTRRASVIKDAFDAARRVEERRLVVSAMAVVPTHETAGLLTSLLDEEALKEDAAVAAINVAKSLKDSEKETAQELIESVLQADVGDELKAQAEEALD